MGNWCPKQCSSLLCLSLLLFFFSYLITQEAALPWCEVSIDDKDDYTINESCEHQDTSVDEMLWCVAVFGQQQTKIHFHEAQHEPTDQPRVKCIFLAFFGFFYFCFFGLYGMYSILRMLFYLCVILNKPSVFLIPLEYLEEFIYCISIVHLINYEWRQDDSSFPSQNKV